MERLFVDTSAWFAYGNRGDPDHKRVRTALRSFEGRLVTSNFILDETITLCRYRRGHADAATLGRVLQSGDVVDLVRVAVEDERAAWRLFLERVDQAYSYTDCTSFALLRRLRIDRVAALDEDFRSEGFVVVPEVKPRRSP